MKEATGFTLTGKENFGIISKARTVTYAECQRRRRILAPITLSTWGALIKLASVTNASSWSSTNSDFEQPALPTGSQASHMLSPLG